MINNMKSFKLFALLCVLGVFFASCKEPKNEWENYFGYTNQELVGSYVSSNVTDAFDGLIEGTYCHICHDATIKVTPNGGKLKFEIKSPNNGLTHNCVGDPSLSNNDCLIQIGNELLATVYTNSSQGMRIHGYVRINDVNYYFDVIKE